MDKVIRMKFLNTVLMTCVLIVASSKFAYSDEAPQNKETQKETQKDIKQVGETIKFKDALVAAYNLTYLSSAQYDVKGGYEALSAAKREWLPTAGINSNYNNTFKNARSRNTPTQGGTVRDNIHSNSANLGLSVNQNLFAGGKTMAGIRVGEKGVDKAIAGYWKQEASLLFGAIQAYSNVVLKQAIYNVRVANKKVLEEQTTMARNTHELGANTISDVAQTESKLAKARAAVTSARAEEEAAKASFEKLTGLSNFSGLEEPSLPLLLPKSREEAVEWAFQNNNDLKVADAEAEEFKERVKVARADLLPNLDISAGVSRHLEGTFSSKNYNVTAAQGFSKSSSSQFEAGVQLKIPLDFRGSTQVGVRKVKYDAAKKRIDAINTRRHVTETVTAKWEMMVARKKNIEEAEEQVKAAKVAYDCMKEEFGAGMKTTLHLLMTEQEYFNSQIELVDAQQQHLQACYELLKDIGTLTAESLDLPVEKFDGENYQERVPVWGMGIEE
jgi:TolC family type I secretion outer membrane protein